MRHLTRAAILFALVAVLPADAATKQEKIHELIAVTGVPEQMEKALESIWPMIIQHDSQANPNVPKEAWARCAPSARRNSPNPCPTCWPSSSGCTTSISPKEEIDGLLSFYKTPVGKRLIARLSDEMHRKGYDMHL